MRSSHPPIHLFVFTAEDRSGLVAWVQRVAAFVAENDRITLRDLAYSLWIQRKLGPARMALTAATREDLLQKLKDFCRGRNDRAGVIAQSDRRDPFLAALGQDPAETAAYLGCNAGVPLPRLVLIWCAGLARREIDSILAQQVPKGRLLSFSREAGNPPQPVPWEGKNCDAVEKGEHYPLTKGQEGLWFIQQMEPENYAYNIPTAFRVPGAVNVAVLRKALEGLAARHPILKSRVEMVDGKPMGYLDPKGKIDFIHEPCTDSGEALRRLRKSARQPLPLETGPLTRIHLVSLAENEHLLLMVVHHLVFDGTSLGQFLLEFGVIYEALAAGDLAELPPAGASYTDFARWQARMLSSAEGTRHWAYWRVKLADEWEPLELPSDFPRPAIQTFAGEYFSVSLDTKVMGDLARLARREKTSPFIALLSIFKALCFRYTQQRDIIVGTPLAGRPQSRFEETIGYFLNMVPLRDQLRPRAGFTALLRQVGTTVWDAFEHGDFPFPLMVERLAPKQDRNRHPIFQVCFILQNWLPSTSPEQGNPKRLVLEHLPGIQQVGEFDLTLEIFTHSNEAVFKYNPDLFGEATIVRMAGHFQRLMKSVIADPHGPLARLPIMEDSEQERVLRHFNRTERPIPRGCVHQIIEQRAAAVPDTVALLGEASGDDRAPTRHLSYAALDGRAAGLALHLRGLGVGPGRLAALCMHRQTEMVIGLVGILKAGGGYVPLDPSFPPNRLEYMLADSGAVALLTREGEKVNVCNSSNQNGSDRHPVGQEVTLNTGRAPSVVLTRTGDVKALDGRKGHAQSAVMVEPAHGAYVIYTSGSTGLPKGVEITHRSLTNFLRSMTREPGLDPGDILLAVTTISFDIAGLEIYLPLVNGARLVLAGAETAADGRRLAKRLAETASSFLQATPATWRLLLAAGWQGNPRLRMVCGGEALPRDLAEKLTGLGRDLWNVYGPTETTIWSSAARITATETSVGRATLSIGTPIDNTQIHIFDGELQPVPLNVPGELHIGGAGLARGYFRQPAKTALQFIPDPFNRKGGARLYKTGDRARRLANGNLEYLTRMDQQVKLRGYRIEVGEIEARLVRHPAVRQAVVEMRQTCGDAFLAAFLTLRQKEPSADSPGENPRRIDEEALGLRAFLQQALPDYMVPTAFFELAKLPLTPNGKIDRKSLRGVSLPERGRALATVERSGVLGVLASIWEKVLALEAVAPEDHFFRLGGHSLLATQVCSRIHQTLGVDLPVKALFENPTLAKLARKIEQSRQTDRDEILPLAPASREGPLPLSYAQQRLWFLHQAQPGNVSFNIGVSTRFLGWMDAAGLEATVGAIVARHEILRTSFVATEDQPIQLIHPYSHWNLPVIDLTGLGRSVRPPLQERYIDQEASMPFDLAKTPLLRNHLVRLQCDEHVLILGLHHIVADGWSGALFIKEMAAIYTARLLDRSPDLPLLPVQYADFAVWQRSRLSGRYQERLLAFWRAQLQNAPTKQKLPSALPAPVRRDLPGKTLNMDIPDNLTLALHEVCRREEVTLFMVLLAAFKVLVHCHSGERDLIVGTDVANRNQARIEGLIGFFVNQLVFRTHFDGDPDFREILARVRETALAAYAHQDMPFNKLVEALNPPRDEGANPFFQMKFVLQNAPSAELHLPGLRLEAVPATRETGKIDLQINLWEADGRLTGSIHYKPGGYDKASIARLLRHYEAILQCIVENAGIGLSAFKSILTDADQHHRKQQMKKLRQSAGVLFQKPKKKTFARPLPG